MFLFEIKVMIMIFSFLIDISARIPKNKKKHSAILTRQMNVYRLLFNVPQ